MNNTILDLKELLSGYRIVIEQHHIDFFDREYKRFCKTRFNADSLVLEYDLLYRGYVSKPHHIAHDIQFGHIKPDFKEIYGIYHNIYGDGGKYKWMCECASQGLVTHYIPFKVANRDRMQDRKEKRLYKVGDGLIIEPIEISESVQYLKRAVKSQRDNCDRYIIVG